MADNLIIKIKGDASDFNKTVKSVVSDAKKSFKGIGDELNRELKRVETVGTTAFKGITGIIGGAITGATALLQKGNAYNMEIEQGINSLSILLGDTQKAQEMFEELREYDKISPFDLNQLIASAKEMMAYGIEQEKVVPMMKIFGDIAMGDQEKLSHLALAFAQCSSAGKLMGQDLNQMINAGFNPLEYIAKRTGKTVGELREEMSKGAISVDMVTQAFVDATSAGGRFYNATEIGSQTIQGKMSIMQADFEAFLGEVSQEFTNVFGGKIVPTVSDYLDQIMDAFHEKGFQGLIEVSGEIVSDAITRIAEVLPSAVRMGVTVTNSLLDGLHTNVPQIVETAELLMDEFLNGIRAIMPTLLEIAKEIIATVLAGFIQYKALIMEMGIQIITTLAEGIAESMPTLGPEIVDLVIYLIDLLVKNMPTLLQSLITIISSLAQSIMDKLPEILAGIGELVYSLLNTLLDNIGEWGPALLKVVVALLAAAADIIVVALVAIVQHVMEWCKSLGNTISNWWNGTIKPKIDLAVSVVKECFRMMKEEVKGKVEEIKTNISSKVNEIKTTVTSKTQELVTSVVNKIKELPSKMISIGTDIVQGIWNGIGNARAWLEGKISSLVGDITGWFKSKLGISSPSKVFAEYGGFMTQGLAVGLMKEVPDLQNAAKRQLRDLQNVYEDFKLDVPNMNIPMKVINQIPQTGSTSVSNVTNENGNVFNFNNYFDRADERSGEALFNEFQRKVRQFGGI